MFPKANQTAKRPKTETLKRRKHRRSCNINKERYQVSAQAAHICWVEFFFIQKGCILWFHAARLFVGGLFSHTCHVPWRHSEGFWSHFAWLRKWCSPKLNTSPRKVGWPILSCRPTSALSHTRRRWLRVFGWWDPAQHYPLHLAIVHYCARCRPVSEAIKLVNM